MPSSTDTLRIHCTIQGTADPLPALVVDTDPEHPYDMVLENPTRGTFTLPGTTPPHGAWIHGPTPSIRIPQLPGHPGDFEGPLLVYTPAAPPLVTINDDHFLCEGRPWYVRGTDGFCDYQVFLDRPGDLGPLLRQSQELGGNLRRVFGMMKNITAFDPARYGDRYYDSLPAFCEELWAYEHFVEFDVLPDSGYWDKSLGWCRDHWARVCEVLAPVRNRLISLTNEFDHGGNLVGSPDDYPRPNIELVSQGSAVSDAPPPRPGWGFREWHNLRGFPKAAIIEDMWFNREGINADGSTWGPRKPIVFTECERFEEDKGFTDERLARTLAYESMAFGSGMVFHNDPGKYSHLMSPRVARCCETAMRVLERGI
jgi:hypothetical protein